VLLQEDANVVGIIPLMHRSVAPSAIQRELGESRQL
jgi:hypothetical protein